MSKLKVAYLLFSLLLLYFGAEVAYEGWKNPKPTRMTVADYVKSDKSKEWVVLTDAKINLLNAVTVTTTTTDKRTGNISKKGLTELYIPIESAGSTQNDTVSLLLKTNDKEIIDVASQLTAMSEAKSGADLLLHFIVRKRDKLIRNVELSGLMERGEGGEIREHIKNLAGSYYILKHNSTVSLIRGLIMMGIGLLLLTIFIFSLRGKVVKRKAYENLSKPEKGSCPKCHGPGPVDVHTSYWVWSLLLFTRWGSRPQICCQSCGTKSKIEDAFFSLVCGWWGIPWGLLITPLQIIRNVVGLFTSPDPLKIGAVVLFLFVVAAIPAYFNSLGREDELSRSKVSEARKREDELRVSEAMKRENERSRSKVAEITAREDELSRSKVSEAIRLLEGVKPAVEKYMADKGKFPPAIELLALLSETDKASIQYTASIIPNPEESYLEATLKKEGSVLAGKTVRLTYSPKSKTWRCSAAHPNGIPQEYLPSECK